MIYEVQFTIRYLSILLIFLSVNVNAQDSTAFRFKEPIDLTDGIQKDHTNWIAPTMAAVTYVSFTYVCYRNFDSDIKTFVQRNQSNFSTDIAHGVSYFGLGKVQSIALAGTAVIAFSLHNDKLKQATVIWAASLLMNSTITDQLKKTFQRHRPNTGDPYNTFDWRGGPGTNKSFPSAHTSNAFTTATVFATIYKDKKWVPPVAYSLAAAVGISRIYNNVHWTSDVLTGAAIGFLSAKSMHALYKFTSSKLTFLPQMDHRTGSVTIIYNL